MRSYEEQAYRELELWKLKMRKGPTLFNFAAKSTQNRINKLIPEKAHKVITVAI